MNTLFGTVRHIQKSLHAPLVEHQKISKGAAKELPFDPTTPTPCPPTCYTTSRRKNAADRVTPHPPPPPQRYSVAN
ncbi:hypothetical protein GWI33_002654 [Rhynchophorus ferrugineus]|uniref:Uncharacterized protein n=1 Tax=Rhynchophorus ferrugineus TaxID=354439 RepID=A0A834IK62_RHYFE|nr:hypothetical protein GWI33_002654 [Rhynchophorus ferrugineus]